METIVVEEGFVWLKVDVCASLILCRGCCVLNQNTLLELGCPYHSITIRTHLKMGAKEVNRLDTNTIHAHRLLESL